MMLLLNLSFFSFIVVSFTSMFFLYLYLCLYSSFSTNSISLLYNQVFISDEISLFMTIMTCLVIFVSIAYSVEYYKFNSVSVSLVTLFMFFVCLMVFMSDNLFFLYLFYEFSLIPILIIVIKWGIYPDRSLSAMMLILYTALFSFPFMICLFYSFVSFGSLSFCLISVSDYILLFDSSTVFSMSIFLCFAVKLPVYGLHFWLPMAHVEAPTFGSMILAGILLKLGGVGLLRFQFLMNVFSLQQVVLSYFIVFVSVTTFICAIQSDFKRLIAYSSVSHMMAIPLMVLFPSLLSVKGITLLMFFHGISSPLLFMLVSLCYSFFGSRQIVLSQGMLLFSPLISLMMILAFFFTLSAPPFPSFVSEVTFFMSSFPLTDLIALSFLVFAFMSLVYNLHWLSGIVFSMPNVSMSFEMAFVSFKSFFPLFLSLAFSFISVSFMILV